MTIFEITHLSRCSSSASGVFVSASMECDVLSSLELFPPGVCELALLFGSTRRSDGCRTIAVDDGRSVIFNGIKIVSSNRFQRFWCLKWIKNFSMM